jgi:SPOR domain
MAAVAAVVGLVAGVLLGFSAGGPGSPARAGVAPKTSTGATAPATPDKFYTVVLASIAIEKGRGVADARAAELRNQGVQPVGVLESSRYSTLVAGYFVIYSGQFPDKRAADGHLAEIRAQFPSMAGSYVRPVQP